jgi:ornithine cyclodeaminase/alanine dehydrogenase-like protein (mu-crystallin family)
MDGTIVSAARTGAVTGVSARRLARADARVAAILGAGDHERTEAFRTRSDRVVPVANAEDACRGADVIVAATMAPEPYVPSE